MRLGWVLSGMLVAAFVADAGAGDVVETPSDGWSLTLPAGWKTAAPGARLASGIGAIGLDLGAVSRAASNHIFTKASPDAPALPLVLVRFRLVDLENATFSDIDRGLATMRPPEGQFFRPPTLDRSRKRIELWTTSTSPETGELRAWTVNYLGKAGMIQLDCVAPGAEFDRVLPEFRALADSFRFRDGFAYAEPSFIDWKRWGWKLAAGAAVAAVLAIVRMSHGGRGGRRSAVRRAPGRRVAGRPARR